MIERFLDINSEDKYLLINIFLDFLCSGKKLIIEVDGLYHMKRKDEDSRRDKYFTAKGFKILRLTNAEILNDIDIAINKIKKMLVD